MRTAGIICEYNPFHTGHKRQIDILHSTGHDCVVCVMSGNCTQRGELTIFDKYTRAGSAVLGGADIVLELPFPYSSMSAEGFAGAGVHILASLGVDTLCFGSECGDKELLEAAADAVLSPEFPEIYSALIKSGLGSAAAYFEALRRISGRDASLLSNDILGISYIAAVKRHGHDLDFLPIKREGAAYNDKFLTDGKHPSASAIREAIRNSDIDIFQLLDGYMPDGSLKCLENATKSGRAPVFTSDVGSEVLSFFKLMSPDEIAARAISRSGGGDGIAEDGCGICERLCNTAKGCHTFEEFIQRSATSKYTDARLNRVILFSLLGASDIFSRSMPEYTTLLAANSIGRAFLSEIRKKEAFKIVTKPADAPVDSFQKRLSEAADALYSQAMPSNIDANIFIKSHPFML